MKIKRTANIVVSRSTTLGELNMLLALLPLVTEEDSIIITTTDSSSSNFITTYKNMLPPERGAVICIKHSEMKDV